MAGYLQISRKLFSHPLWEEERTFSRAEAWLDLIREATWKDKSLLVQGRRVKLRRGELVASVRFLAVKWHWSKSKVERFIFMLSDESMIETRTETGISVITLLKYDDYNPEHENSGTRSGRARDSNRDSDEDTGEDSDEDKTNTVKKENKGKKRARAAHVPPTLQGVEGFQAEWEAFLDHRRTIKKPASARAQELTLAKLAQRPAQAVEALQITISKSWQNFEWEWIENYKREKTNGNRPGNSSRHGADRNQGTANAGRKGQYALERPDLPDAD